MEIDTSIGSKFFPLGCPKCKSEVLFLEASEYLSERYDGYVFACSNSACGCYVKGHKTDIGVARAGEPMGILADKELRSLHDLVRAKFSVLWQKRLINYLLHEFIVSFSDENGETRYGAVCGADNAARTYSIRTETGEEFSVPISMTSKTDSRSRSYYWLAQQLGLSVYQAQIPMLDAETSCRAVDIIDNQIKQLNIKQNESDNNS